MNFQKRYYKFFFKKNIIWKGNGIKKDLRNYKFFVLLVSILASLCNLKG